MKWQQLRGAEGLAYQPRGGRFLVRMFRVGSEYSEPRNLYAVFDRASLVETWKLSDLVKKELNPKFLQAHLDRLEFEYAYDAFPWMDVRVDWYEWMEEEFPWITGDEEAAWIPPQAVWDEEDEWGGWTHHVVIPLTSLGPGDPHLKVESEHGFYESSSLPKPSNLFPSIRNLKGSSSQLFDLDAYLK